MFSLHNVNRMNANHKSKKLPDRSSEITPDFVWSQDRPGRIIYTSQLVQETFGRCNHGILDNYVQSRQRWVKAYHSGLRKKSWQISMKYLQISIIILLFMVPVSEFYCVVEFKNVISGFHEENDLSIKVGTKMYLNGVQCFLMLMFW